MASNRNVVVLTPHGRRQTVKVTPNMTILQVIEEVCKKHGFNPEDYDIKHHKHVLDINSTFGFSGLPNNAQLELLASTKPRIDSEVTIALQLESGNRLLGTFKPDNTVYDVVFSLTPDDLSPEKNTIIIYMRLEMHGTEQLKKTDLRSLGLTNGRAIFRLIHRLPSELKIQANVSAPLPAKPVEEKPYMRKLQRVDSPPHTLLPPVEPLPRQKTPEEVRESLAEDIPKTLGDVENVAKKPCTEEKKMPENTYKKTNMVDLIKGEKKRQQQMNPQKVVLSETPRSVENNNKKIDDEFVFLGDRNAMLFSLETAQSIRTEDLPDDFFELTIEDAKKLLRDIKRHRAELENGPLMTSALRNLEESKRQLRALNKYTKAIIRIQFPNRTVLQGTFLATEDISVVMKFVSDYLEDKKLDFYLYTTPPKVILKKESTLLEIGCLPGALLHFGVPSSNMETQFLRQDLRNKFTTSSMASLAAAKMRQQAKRTDSPSQDSDDDVVMTPVDNNVNVGASTSTAQYVDYDDKPSTSKEETKVPKWFKTTK